MGIVEIQVMYDTVSEHRCKYLPLLGIFHYEAFRGLGLVASGEEIFAQTLHILLQIHFPLADIRAFYLATTSAVVGNIQVS